MRAVRVAWITAVFAVLTAAATPAGAAPTARDRAEAKRLSLEALAAFKRRKYAAAAAAYRRADELDPSAQLKSGNVCPDEPEVVNARNAAIRSGNISTAAFYPSVGPGHAGVTGAFQRGRTGAPLPRQARKGQATERMETTRRRGC